MILVYHSPFEFLKEHHIGGVLIMANMLKKPEALAEQLKYLQERLPIGLLVTVDQEGGQVNRLSSMEKWEKVASAKKLSNMNSDSISRYTARVGLQLKDLHINTNLAPILDPSHNWKGEETFMYMKNRSFGRKAEEIVPPVKAFIKGFTSQGVLCIAKHFPGYDVATNSDHNIAVSQADSQAVAEYVQAFAQVMPEVAGVLMSSIHFQSFCEKPSVFSPRIMAWARSLGEDKLIITDDLWGTALRSYVSPHMKIHPVHYPDKEFVKLIEMAFIAGNDMLMITFPQKVELIKATILRMVSKNRELEKRLDSSVKRILLAKQKLGLIRAPESSTEPQAEKSVVSAQGSQSDSGKASDEKTPDSAAHTTEPDSVPADSN
jgi:beta-N-acetylhexosaminidase